jgi:hypothetical protein
LQEYGYRFVVRSAHVAGPHRGIPHIPVRR